MPLMGSLSTSGTEIRAPLLGVRSHNAFGQLTVMGRGAGSQRLRVPVGAVGWLGCCAAAVPRSSACAVALPRPRQVLHAAHARFCCNERSGSAASSARAPRRLPLTWPVRLPCMLQWCCRSPAGDGGMGRGSGRLV